MIARDLRTVGVVEQQAVVAIAFREVAAHHEALRIHDRVADVVAEGGVAAHLAVVGVHVVHGEAQVAEAVSREQVAPADAQEDAVAVEADVVALHPRARRVPDGDPVAVLG
jgi:hypothetical protein